MRCLFGTARSLDRVCLFMGWGELGHTAVRWSGQNITLQCFGWVCNRIDPPRLRLAARDFAVDGVGAWPGHLFQPFASANEHCHTKAPSYISPRSLTEVGLNYGSGFSSSRQTTYRSLWWLAKCLRKEHACRAVHVMREVDVAFVGVSCVEGSMGMLKTSLLRGRRGHHLPTPPSGGVPGPSTLLPVPSTNETFFPPIFLYFFPVMLRADILCFFFRRKKSLKISFFWVHFFPWKKFNALCPVFFGASPSK